MAYRLASERVSITVEGGPAVEVWTIGAWPIYRAAVGLVSAFLDAEGDGAEFTALQAVYAFFVREAQPTWAIVDHRGPVLPTAEGMLRLPVTTVALPMIEGWVETFLPKPTAVDAMVPEGPLRDELNVRLRRSKKAD